MGQHKKEGKLENRAGAIKAGILMGIALFAGFAFQIIGLQYTTPSKNAFLTALNVVIVPFIAFIILKKKVGMKGIIGAIMSVIGVALLSLNGNLTLSLGDGLTLLCAVGFAFQIFFTGESVKKISGICTEHGADDHSICIIGSQSCDFWRERFSGYNTGMVKCFVSGSNQYDCMLSAPDRMPEVCR